MKRNQQLAGEIIAMIREMNRIWTGAWDEETFRNYIHPEAVAIAPTTPGRLNGRDQYVAGWRGFVQATTIHEWNETDHTVQLYADDRCAVVTYLFTITFSMGGRTQVMRGRDMLFLVNEQDRWLIAADQFSPEPML